MGLYNNYFQDPCNLQLHRDKPRALKWDPEGEEIPTPEEQ
jgi:hypothetical protein